MRRNLLALCTVSSILFLSGCASSGKLIDSYRAPGTVSFVYNRAAVMVLNGGPDLRSSLEAEIVARVNGKRLVAAHSVLAASDLTSVPAVRQKLVEQKFDGIVTMRLVRPGEINEAASRAGESFSSYAGSVPPGLPAFGEGKVRIETSVFRLADEQLIWRGIVETSASNDPRILVRNTVDVVVEHLRDIGLVHD